MTIKVMCEVCEKEVDPNEVHTVPTKQDPLISCDDCMKFVVQAINDDREQYLLSIIKSQQHALNAYEKYSLIDKMKESEKDEQSSVSGNFKIIIQQQAIHERGSRSL